MIAFCKKYPISILLSILIFVACFMSLSSVPSPGITNFDKFVHFVMFFFLSGTVFFENTFFFKNPISYQRIIWGSFLFPIVFSGSIEIVQEYVSPYRSGDWMDFLWDCIGVFIALAVCLKINSRISAK